MSVWIAALAFASLGQARDTSPHSQATLVAAVSRVAPGQKFLAAVRIQMEPGWHCYWRNPGDSGLATNIRWKLPAGWKASEVLWPVPHVLTADGATVYGFEKEALFLAYLTPPKSAKAGTTYRLQANVDWLICKESCLSANESATLAVRVGTAQPDSTWGKRLQMAYASLPKRPVGWQVHAVRKGKTIELALRPPNGLALTPNVRFIAADPETIAHGGEQRLSGQGPAYVLTIPQSEYASKPPSRLRGLLVGGSGFAIDLDIVISSS